jgi:mevalonate kinase
MSLTKQLTIANKVVYELVSDTPSPVDAIAMAYDALVEYDRPYEITDVMIKKHENDGTYSILMVGQYVGDEKLDPAWI